jgi:signal transduction histidine kinase/DNA-binding response OmpR family regulator
MKTQPPHNAMNPHEEIQRLRSAVEELKLLNEIAMEASGAGSIEAMLGMIIDKSLKVVNAEQGSILLVTGEADASLKTFIRQDNRSSLRHSYHVGAHIIGSVVYSRKPLLIENLAADRRFETNDQERADIRSVLCVPIINQGRLIGVFLMVNKKGSHSFTSDDQRLLMILSAQAGQLIAGAQLQEEANRKKEELAVARLEAEKGRELAELKSRFFADISHEFRTPLTLILGPIEQLIARARESDPQADYRRIRRNAHRLLRLITDLLNLSRLEAKSMKLRVHEGDLVPLVRSIVESFHPLAEQNGIKLDCTSVPSAILGFFDREKVETILYNLLSNALKFTPPNGTIGVALALSDAEPASIRRAALTVTDSGRGIPAGKLAHLFDRYYQVEEADRQMGTGLGLALTRGLVELHRGTINVTSGESQGSSFAVQLPIDRSCFTPGEIMEEEPRDMIPGTRNLESVTEPPETVAASESSQAATSGLPLMLIVEDDPDMRRFLCENLKNSFRIFEASDGEIGLSIAREVTPDIVISDVGMPAMDGIQLCRNLKDDERTSHIPVLLLTAKAAQDTKMAGFETGADDYITKPFDWLELETRVDNLVEGRRRLRERFARMTLLMPSEIAITSMDEVFLRKVMASIERSMGDETFSVEDLARDVAMSYSQVHRKLSALLSQSPNQLIRSMRLQRAKDLIERNAGTISEIAYTVGFGSPVYLTKCFREQFGIVPSQVRRKPNPPSPGV